MSERQKDQNKISGRVQFLKDIFNLGEKSAERKESWRLFENTVLFYRSNSFVTFQVLSALLHTLLGRHLF